MKVSKKLQKLRLFSVRELIQLVGLNIGQRLVHQAPKTLVASNGLVNGLLVNGAQINRVGDKILFSQEINGSPVKFHLKCDSSDSWVFNQIISNKEYGVLIELFNTYGLQCNSIVDAGANIGLTTLFLSSYFPQANIVALEPALDTFNRLEQNIKANNLDKVCLLNKGLWGRNAWLSPDLTFRGGQDWSFRLVESTKPGTGAFEVVTVSELMNQFGLEQIDLLKMDIEGGEVSVFAEESELEWLNKIRVIAIEIHDEFDVRQRIEGLLTAFGFDVSFSGELTIGVKKTFRP